MIFMVGKWKYIKTSIALLLVSIPAPACAQSCPICITAVEASKATFIAGLRSGILILIFPPLLICLSLAFTVYRRDQAFSDLEKDTQANDLQKFS
jgi:hypothetical protein